MKKFLFFTFMLFLSINTYAQIGMCSKALSLQDNSFVGGLWEPTGTVNYTEKNGEGIYGLVISMNTSDTYLDMEIGYKVSVEYTDSTREVLTIAETAKNFGTKIVSHSVVEIYKRNILIYPNYDNLTSKTLNRFVIQRGNGNVWIINTKPKRAKKLIPEFQKAMQEAKSSYKAKVSNDNYFN